MCAYVCVRVSLVFRTQYYLSYQKLERKDISLSKHQGNAIFEVLNASECTCLSDTGIHKVADVQSVNCKILQGPEEVEDADYSVIIISPLVSNAHVGSTTQVYSCDVEVALYSKVTNT